MTVEPQCWGGGGVVSHPLQLTTGLVINNSVTTSPTLAGERMLLILKVSILSEQMIIISTLTPKGKQEEVMLSLLLFVRYKPVHFRMPGLQPLK